MVLAESRPSQFNGWVLVKSNHHVSAVVVPRNFSLTHAAREEFSVSGSLRTGAELLEELLLDDPGGALRGAATGGFLPLLVLLVLDISV